MAESTGNEASTKEEVPSINGSPRTRPNCVRCRNHNVKTQLKGHKRYCEFRNCCCNKCLNTQDRQQTMAKQIAKRRKDAEDEKRKLLGLPVPTSPSPPADSENPDTPSSSSSGFNSSSSSTTNYPSSSVGQRPSSNSNISVVSSSTNVSVINRPSSAHLLLPTATSVTSSVVLPNSETIGNINNNDDDNSDNNNNSYSAGTGRSHEPVRIESIIYLMDLFRYQLDIHSLLYVILKEVNSDVKEAYRRITEGQEEMRPLKALLSSTTDYTPQLHYSPLRLPMPFFPPLHQAYHRYHPYSKATATVSPSYAYQISRPGDMFPCECIPKPDYKAELPINLHNDKPYSRSSLEV